MLPRAAGGLMDWWDHARITRPRKNSEKVTRNGCKHCVELSFHTCNRKSSLSDTFHLKEIFCVVKTRADTPWSHWTCLHVPCVCVCVCDAVLFCPTRSFTPHRERFLNAERHACLIRWLPQTVFGHFPSVVALHLPLVSRQRLFLFPAFLDLLCLEAASVCFCQK